MFEILYEDGSVLVIQTVAGIYDKWSDDIYGEYNIALHVGDEVKRVLTCRARLLEQINTITPVDGIYWLTQTHSDIVITAQPCLSAPIADALYSRTVAIGLGIMTADCVPVALFSDSQIACVHAGYQGLAKGIIIKTMQHFMDAPVKAVIGACISGVNYELPTILGRQIITDTLAQMSGQSMNANIDKLFGQMAIINGDKCLFDVGALARWQLDKLGVQVVGAPPKCSYDAPDLYSYRQQVHAGKSSTGRMATLIIKKSLA